MKRNGFTVIELLVVIAVLGVGSWLFFSEKAKVDAVARDNQRKTALNSMYYSLEEYFYPKFGYYPQTIDSQTLRTMDPELFTDPDGTKYSDGGSTYLYNSTGCSTDGKCTGYTLLGVMEREDDYVKHNREHKNS